MERDYIAEGETAMLYLSEVHAIRRRLVSLQLEAERLRVRAEGLRAMCYDKDRVQTSATNRVDDAMAKLLQAEQEYQDELDKCREKTCIREEQLSGLGEQQAELLRLRYIEQKDGRQMTIAEISERMGISYDRARHMHREALSVFASRYTRA